MTIHRYLTVAVVVFLCACAGQGTGAPRESRDMTVLSGSELYAQAGSNLYDQIRRVRPNWLRVRGATSLTQGQDEVVVYQDGVKQGGVAILREFQVESVESVRYLSGPEAASRFGHDHQHGAILNTLRKR